MQIEKTKQQLFDKTDIFTFNISFYLFIFFLFVVFSSWTLTTLYMNKRRPMWLHKKEPLSVSCTSMCPLGRQQRIAG